MIKIRFMGGKARTLNSLRENQDVGFQIATGLWPHTDMERAARVQIRKRETELCLAKQLVQIGGGRVVSQEIECAVCYDLSRCPQKCSPCCEREP